VVETFAALRQELPDRALGAERLEQLDLAVARGQQRTPCSLTVASRTSGRPNVSRQKP